MTNTTILLASRSETVCALIRCVIKKHGDYSLICVQEAEALELRLNGRTPDILLIETCFMHEETPSFIARLAREKRGLHVAVFALDECPAYYAAIFIARGAESFLCFRSSMSEWQRAVDLMLSGKTYLPREVEDAVNERDTAPIGNGEITAREKEVGRLIACGFTLKEIAQKLAVSEKTAETHRTKLYAKTNSRKRSDFVSYAIRTGLMKREAECSYA